MFEVREVLRLWLDGEGIRATERLVGFDRKTVRRYVDAAVEAGLVRGGLFALAAPGALEALIESAGLSAEQAFEVATPFEYRDLEAAVRANLSSGPGRAAIAHAGRDAARDAVAAALEPFVRPGGSVRLDNVMRAVVARA